MGPLIVAGLPFPAVTCDANPLLNERDWRALDAALMLAFAGDRLDERQARRFAVACCRRVEHRISDERVAQALEAADRAARGELDEEARRAAHGEMLRVYAETAPTGAFTLSHGVLPPVQPFLDVAVAIALSDSPAAAYLFANDPERPLSAERAAQADLLRDLVAYPGRPVVLKPSWRTPAVRGLAAAIDEDDDFALLPILGDALEEAGCDDEAILGHCREPLTHVPGCWLVREVLGGAGAR
jgi:hypothetical protein